MMVAAEGRTVASPHAVLATLLTDLVAPVVFYYLLRVTGAGIYTSLLISAIMPVATAVVRLIRHRRIDGFAVYTASVMIAGALVSLIGGSPRFLLAREGWLTGMTGAWFIVSLFLGRYPLGFAFSRPFLEGRLARRGVPPDWDELWDGLPRFRRLWHVTTVLWGVGLFVDAVARVVMAYCLPIDTVPALSASLYALTSAVLLVVTNLCYWSAGLFDSHSALYAPFERLEAPSVDVRWPQ